MKISFHLIISLNFTIATDLPYFFRLNKESRNTAFSDSLFQGRFKAILIDANEYLTILSRYIHLNPVRAKMVKHPMEYPWSSYPAFAGKRRKPDWLNTETVLSYFGREKKESAVNHRNYIEKSMLETIENPDKNLVGEVVLGGTGFVNWVKDTFLSTRNTEREIPQLRKLKL